MSFRLHVLQSHHTLRGEHEPVYLRSLGVLLDDRRRAARVMMSTMTWFGRSIGTTSALLLLLNLPTLAFHPSPSTSPGLGSSGMQIVASSRFAIEVPMTWKVERATLENCTKAKGSEVIVGSALALRDCLPTTVDATFLEVGHGAPPPPPLPAARLKQTSVHGVPVRIVTGILSLFKPFQSYMLVFLGGWDNWLLFAAPGTLLSQSLMKARAILATLYRTGRSLSTWPGVKGSFLGQWTVHDGSLEIWSAKAGTELYRSGCAPASMVGFCSTKEWLRFRSSSSRSILTARITKVEIFDASFNLKLEKTVIDPRTGGFPGVGESFTLQFAAPDLLIELTTGSDEVNFGFINPYWCSAAHQQSRLIAAMDYCGA